MVIREILYSIGLLIIDCKPPFSFMIWSIV